MKSQTAKARARPTQYQRVIELVDLNFPPRWHSRNALERVIGADLNIPHHRTNTLIKEIDETGHIRLQHHNFFVPRNMIEQDKLDV